MKKRREREYGAKAEWIVRLPCAACFVQGEKQKKPTVPAHAVKTRGAGGKSDTLVPLCETHEDLWHTLGRKTFAVRFGVNLVPVASALDNIWNTREAA